MPGAQSLFSTKNKLLAKYVYSEKSVIPRSKTGKNLTIISNEEEESDSVLSKDKSE